MKFDVFISFRGIDTRRTFVSHLLLALFNRWITTFKHEEEILENQPLSPQVLQAIEESKTAIVIISKNYAASSRCLDELATIMECKRNIWLQVVPIFYEVDPWDALRQVDDLWDNGNEDDNLVKVKRWRDALEILIHIYFQKYSYWEKKDSYSYIIDEVLRYVSLTPASARHPYSALLEVSSWRQLSLVRPSSPPEDIGISRTSLFSLLSANVTEVIRRFAAALRRFMYGKESSGVKHRPLGSFLDEQDDNYVTCDNLSRFVLSNDFNSLLGMNQQLGYVYTLLDMESSYAILEKGISGKPGVGKTTLARCVYEQISPQFQDHHYFINDTTNYSLGASLLDDITKASLAEESESLEEV